MAQMADLYLKPPMQNYGTLEFKKFQDIYHVGYTYAKPLVREFAKQLSVGQQDFGHLIPKHSPTSSPRLAPKPHRFE